jgi:class 3 adenylate cyclase
MNYYGDASLTMFSSAIEAVKCGSELQRLFHNEYNLPMRMGIHLGEVVLENETIYGNGVNIASRLESMGVAGSVFISGAVYTELENQDELYASHIGAFKLKNITNPVEVYAVNDPLLVLPEAKDLKS